MDMNNNQLSFKCYYFLCDILGNEEVVNKRRHIFNVRDDINCMRKHLTSLTSGSKAEGLNLKGSDLDQMAFSNDLLVVERLEQRRDERMALVMDTKNTKPGFTMIFQHPQSIYSFPGLIVNRNGLSYLSSTLCRQQVYEPLKHLGIYIHGPCTTSCDGEYDIAHSLHCKSWISQALPWLNRSKYSWASDEVIQNILTFGVLFVAIGSKNSINADIEWRISFSYAEKQLIFSFNHVQFLCYALLKILLDLLCSYFMKTILFWLCEETDKSCWTVENMFSCFMTCLRRLVYCVEHNTCLHYFIPENNLFENRFQNQHARLLSTLHGLYNSGWTCLLQTETLRSFTGYLKPSLPSTISFATYLPFLRLLDDLIYIDVEYVNCSMIRCIYNITRSRKTRDIYIFCLTRLFQLLAQNGCNEERNNKLSYRESRQWLSRLLIGINHDAVSGWLLLATFYLKNKQYRISRILVDHCLTKFTPQRGLIPLKEDYENLQCFANLQNIVGPKFMKNYIMNVVRFIDNSTIIPDEYIYLDGNFSRLRLKPLSYAQTLQDIIFFRRIN